MNKHHDERGPKGPAFGDQEPRLVTSTEQEDEKRKRLRRVSLTGIVTEPEWQCAFLSVPHAVKGKEVFLVWELPGQHDLQLGVTLKAGIVRIRKV